MKNLFIVVLLLVTVACTPNNQPRHGNNIDSGNVHVTGNQDTMPLGSGYWRPISAPNVLMAVNEAQAKLEFDLSQCVCGIMPRNIPTSAMMQFNPDQARIWETARTGHCASPNQQVLTECMRARGWEPTLCAGRLPTGAGGSYCAEAQ